MLSRGSELNLNVQHVIVYKPSRKGIIIKTRIKTRKKEENFQLKMFLLQHRLSYNET